MSIKTNTIRHDVFEVQTGLQHSGHDPGPLDGFWGPKTATAAKAMIELGSRTRSKWAILELTSALADLGWLKAVEPSYEFGQEARAALSRLVNAGGLPFASYVPAHDQEPRLGAGKRALADISEGRVILQGGAVVTLLVLHTTATPGHWWRGKSAEEMMGEVRVWHRARGWAMEGYHRLYAPDGSYAEGRPFPRTGAHVRGHNTGSIGFTMVPIRTINEMGHWSTYYTPEQKQAVMKGIEEVATQTPIKRLAGHNEFANKLCPGFEVNDPDWTDLAVA